MHLTIDQALIQAIEAHKSGRLSEAEQLYRAILQVQPQHVDANHNLGVLAVNLSKTLEAIPHLKKALESNPQHGQFWLSYINALILSEHLDEAKTALDEGKRLGLTGEPVQQLEEMLQQRFNRDTSTINTETQPTRAKKAGKGTKLNATYRRASRPKANPTKQPNQAELDSLLANYNSGNFDVAQEMATRLTLSYPHHSFAWNLLGIILAQNGQPLEAIAPFKKFVELESTNPIAHGNLANAFKGIGSLNEAETFYREAIRLRPNYADAYRNLGLTLHNLGRLKEAEASYREAIRLKPDYPEAYSNLGATLQDLGQIEETEFCLRKAIYLKPDSAEAHNNLGNTLKTLGHLTQAETSYREAIRIKPDFAGAYSNLGNILKDLGHLDTARAAYQEAIRLMPEYAEAYINLGVMLRDAGQFNQAVECYREAIRLKPDLAEAHNNLGGALQGLGQQSEAEASYREAIRLRPDYAAAHSNLLFSLNYRESVSPETALIEAQRYGALVSDQAQPKFTTWPIDENASRLRVGFVSGDLINHPVGYFVESLIKNLDGDYFETFAFPSTPRTDSLTDRIKPHFKHWIPIHAMTDEKAASLIHGHGIHILVDLTGHTAYNRLPVFAYKPAPLQLSWLGYFATTGLPEMDFILGDPIMSPPEEKHHFTERVWTMPETWLCHSEHDEVIPISTVPALNNGYITFGCFGNFSKMNQQVVKAWATILKHNPTAKLLLKAKQFADANVINNVCNMFEALEITNKRLIFEGHSARSEYFQAYNRIDIVLDTFPYPGGTTSVDALWMGVPVLTLKGDRFLSHLGESIATNAGQLNWIAKDLNDYIHKAAELTADLEGLTHLRLTLRQRLVESPLFNTSKFARNFGQQLQDMWQEVKMLSN